MVVKDINQISELANIPLTTKEKVCFGEQLKKIISFVNKLDELDINNINPTYEVTGKVNELREDEEEKSLPVKEVLRNARKTKDSYIVTKAVFNV